MTETEPSWIPTGLFRGSILGVVISRSDEETRQEAARLAPLLKAGDVLLLEGPLGAGKTTFVRGILQALGHEDPVRSPTFNLLQTFATEPPILHADLYRLASWHGIGIEDYLETHICLIEWPDRAEGLLPTEEAWRVRIDFKGEARRITLTPPAKAPG